MESDEQTVLNQDWLLEDLVNQANGAAVGFPVTLTIGALCLTGVLIGVEQYFLDYAGLHEQLFADIDAEAGAAARERYLEACRSVLAEMKAEKQEREQGRAPRRPRYVHLREAQIVTPSGNIPREGGLLWRGRISQVSGFTLGSLISEQRREELLEAREQAEE